MLFRLLFYDIIMPLLAIEFIWRRIIIFRIKRAINKDLSICELINEIMDDWMISPYESNGVRITINSNFLPKLRVYITYQDRKPTIIELDQLRKLIAGKDSIVKEAHKANKCVMAYLRHKYQEHLNENQE